VVIPGNGKPYACKGALSRTSGIWTGLIKCEYDPGEVHSVLIGEASDSQHQ